MDKQSRDVSKRPRVLTLCMLAAAVGTLALAGCGNGNDDMPPAEQPETMEQDATSTSGQMPEAEDNGMMDPPSDPAMTNDPAMADDPAMSDPGLGDEAAASQEPVPGETQDAMNPDEEPGFGNGTDPMPGADEEDDEEMNIGQ
ncbi:hypothetical protein [Vreelandella alkaliphila]|uniref:Lipoprotein n=1 Tax=Vreelandella alkaliphila TaxID=272774 RepID=A0A7C9JRG2_9GAMM|nr:hypothetical protein [Halomonas alkaliphila]NDL69885.1 hypothetical protein [Halomonas alkaliphila]